MNMMSDSNTPRKSWLGLMAKAAATDVARYWVALDMAPEHTVLRSPEIGGVMVRGPCRGCWRGLQSGRDECHPRLGQAG